MDNRDLSLDNENLSKEFCQATGIDVYKNKFTLNFKVGADDIKTSSQILNASLDLTQQQQRQKEEELLEQSISTDRQKFIKDDIIDIARPFSIQNKEFLHQAMLNFIDVDSEEVKCDHLDVTEIEQGATSGRSSRNSMKQEKMEVDEEAEDTARENYLSNRHRNLNDQESEEDDLDNLRDSPNKMKGNLRTDSEMRSLVKDYTSLEKQAVALENHINFDTSQAMGQNLYEQNSLNFISHSTFSNFIEKIKKIKDTFEHF